MDSVTRVTMIWEPAVHREKGRRVSTETLQPSYEYVLKFHQNCAERSICALVVLEVGGRQEVQLDIF